jgi:hypothetical protein
MYNYQELGLNLETGSALSELSDALFLENENGCGNIRI